MSAVYYLHVIPDTEVFYEFRSWPGTELLAVFVGGLAGVFATFLPRWLIPVSFLGMTGIVIGPFLKPVIAPLPDAIFQNRFSLLLFVISYGKSDRQAQSG